MHLTATCIRHTRAFKLKWSFLWFHQDRARHFTRNDIRTTRLFSSLWSDFTNLYINTLTVALILRRVHKCVQNVTRREKDKIVRSGVVVHRNNYELTDSHPSQQNICGTLSIIKMCQTMTRRHSRLNRMYFKPLAIVPLKAGFIEDSFIFLKMHLQAVLQQYIRRSRDNLFWNARKGLFHKDFNYDFWQSFNHLKKSLFIF